MIQIVNNPLELFRAGLIIARKKIAIVLTMPGALSIVYQLSSPNIARTARLKVSPLDSGWVTVRKACPGEKKEEKLLTAVVIQQRKSRGFLILSSLSSNFFPMDTTPAGSRSLPFQINFLISMAKQIYLVDLNFLCFFFRSSTLIGQQKIGE